MYYFCKYDGLFLYTVIYARAHELISRKLTPVIFWKESDIHSMVKPPPFPKLLSTKMMTFTGNSIIPQMRKCCLEINFQSSYWSR